MPTLNISMSVEDEAAIRAAFEADKRRILRVMPAASLSLSAWMVNVVKRHMAEATDAGCVPPVTARGS